MSYHIVSIDSARGDISCREGQLLMSDERGERRIPLEDVAAIVITSFSTRIHSHLLVEAAKRGLPMVICERFQPVSLLLPAARSSDTLLTRRHLHLPARVRERLWEKTIDAKCRNQHTLAEAIAPGSELTIQLGRSAAVRTPRKEGACAKLFWDVFSHSLDQPDFSRGRKLGGLNDLLNYGYAVLLSTVLQKLYAFGLDPLVGISHAIRERSAPLAYDIMEPFRPAVDARVFEWVRDRRSSAAPLTVTTEFRRFACGFVVERVGYLNVELDINGVIEGVVRSFRQAVLAESARLYRPWLRTPTKWAGSSSPSTSPS